MILIRLLVCNFQSWRVKKFIEIQKYGRWRKKVKAVEEVEKETDNADGSSSSESMQEEKMSETEKAFWDRFWDRERNKADVSELMDRKKALHGIELVNLDILHWFCEKWLMDTSTVGEDTKVEFYLWLEANYMEHLIAHQKHKTKHFTSAFSRIKKEAKLQGIRMLINCFVKIGVGIVGILSVSNFEFIYEAVKELLLDEQIPSLAKIFGVFGLLMFVVGIFLWVFRIFMESEQKRQVNAVTASKETWLRHQAVVTGYQKEMLEYIWRMGSYQECVLHENRDRRLMINIKEVWLNNANKFQDNMSKQKLTDG